VQDGTGGQRGRPAELGGAGRRPGGVQDGLQLGGGPQHLAQGIADPVPARGQVRAERLGAGGVQALLRELGPAGVTQSGTEVLHHVVPRHGGGGWARRAARQQPLVEAGHDQGGDADLLAVEGLGQLRRHHVDVVADQVLALAGRIAAAAEGHAEAGEHQSAREAGHGLEVAGEQRAGFGEERGLVLGEQSEGRRPVGPLEQQMGEQPVGLGGRAAEAVAQPRADHARRRGGQDREVHEDAPGRHGGQGLLVAGHGDRGVDRGVAVHGGGRGEDRVGLGILGRHILAEVVDGARADGDEGVRGRSLPAQPGHGRVVGVRPLGQDDGLDPGDAVQRPLDAPAQHRAGRGIADHREPAAQAERGNQLRFPTLEAGLDGDRGGRHGERRPAVRIRQGAGQELVERAHGPPSPASVSKRGRRLSKRRR
jgi:hypothetical protein